MKLRRIDKWTRQNYACELKNCLLNIDEKQRAEKSRQACRNLTEMPQFQEAETVMMYLSLPYEIDTSEAILQCWQCGKNRRSPKNLMGAETYDCGAD